MFATEWGNKNKKNETINLDNYIKSKKEALLVWGEHCTECAVPVCYGKCSKYRRRKDGKCRLFKEGISKIKYNNVSGYEVQFEGWSKLESFYRYKQHSKCIHRLINITSKYAFEFSKFLSNIFEGKNKIWKLTSIPYKLREFLANVLDRSGKSPDCFAVQVFSQENNVKLILEIKSSSQSFYRKSLLLTKGLNSFYIDFDELKFNITKERKYIFIYPENDCKLTFFQLNFITLSQSDKNRIIQKNGITDKIERKKIKCVVWDLDNTLWEGILVEGKVKLNEKIANIIKELDSKGIINSVVSKNNFDEAYNKIKEFKLDEYIIMPHINWIPKSVNIKDLVKRLNIGIDTIAFVDDSPFELAEVTQNCPEVLGVNVLNIDEALQMDCFNVIVTEDSKNRRNTYRMMENQQKELESWEGNIDDFLRSCNMILMLSEPTESEIQRCYELLQRTNQLNSSGRRLELAEIKDIINNKKEFSTYVLKCADKFGDYGIVGFSIVEKIKEVTITDFVISCRVANKKVEHTFIQSIYDEYYPDGNGYIYMKYKKTVKNGPIFNVVKDLNMEKDNNMEEIEVYKYKSSFADKINIVTVKKE